MRSFIALLASLACLAGFASAAPAATVTIGSPLKAPFQPQSCGNDCTLIISTLDDTTAHVTSPVSGTIVRWRLMFGQPGQPYQLRVATPGTAGVYTSTAVSPVAVPSTSGVETFPASIPIAAGQAIGIDLKENALIGYVENELLTTSTYAYFAPGFPALGAPTPFEISNGEFAVNADVQPPPTISSVAPAKASIGGSVAVGGADFTGATAVSFGGVPAASFTVVSDTQIAAKVPKAKKPGPVDVSVTTLAGTATAKFTYTACVVPKLTGKKLKADRRKLRKAGCKLGSVRGEKSKAAKVVKQFRKPGTILPAGAKVGVKLEE